MNTTPTAILRHLRELQPDRNLEDHEARHVAERQALRLLQILGQTGPAVDVSLIAELPRIEVRVESGLPVSGFSQWSRGRWLVAVNKDDSLVRRRFTLAHEFKHVLDNPFITKAYLDRAGKPDEAFGEQICDYFAACLLMPRPWVKREWVDGLQDQALLACPRQPWPSAYGRWAWWSHAPASRRPWRTVQTGTPGATSEKTRAGRWSSCSRVGSEALLLRGWDWEDDR